MIRCINAAESMGVVETILNTAEKTCVLICPFWNLSEHLFNQIIRLANDGVLVLIIHRHFDDKFHDDDVIFNKKQYKTLKNTPNIKLAPVHRLHTKCYFNEKFCFITSFNLTESSLGNFELGMFFDDKEPMYIKVMREVNKIMKEIGLTPYTGLMDRAKQEPPTID